MKALVVRLDSFGDVLLAGPAVRAVAARADHVSMWCGPRGEAAARLLPGVDEVLVWDAPWEGVAPPEVEDADIEGMVRRLRDAAYDVALASPMRSSRLLLIRAGAALTSTIGLIAIAALALPSLDALAAAWLLPALALALASLALSSHLAPVLASSSLAFAWVAAVTLGAVIADDRLAAFRPGAQVAFALVAALAALAIARRTHVYETARGS